MYDGWTIKLVGEGQVFLIITKSQVAIIFVKEYIWFIKLYYTKMGLALCMYNITYHLIIFLNIINAIL